MLPAETAKLSAGINVTPLVDVVLVLLILMMVTLPRLDLSPEVRLPRTERTPQGSASDGQVELSILEDGVLLVDGEPTAPAELLTALRRAADGRAAQRVLIKADARLAFGTVEQAMLVADAAGFAGAGLAALPEARKATE